MTWRLLIGPFPLVGIHPNTPINNTSPSHSFLSLFLCLCFSLCRISQFSPLPYLLCFSNSNIRPQQCTIFRTNAILVFDFGV
ncbi:hypothetical protein VNO78_00435 [Psophocarpus tetragonolobus]|uniref:Uncharacterized protein n=1 Tax=Psophocarpus tetragonolobus TaxID=3891 RepID=A0AAN9XU30_PSOTE